MMGWDAYSSAFSSREALPVFAQVAERIGKKYGTVDGFLQHGGLDVSRCGEMLETATRLSVYGEPWNEEKVKGLAVVSLWHFKVAPEDEWAKASAKAFLLTCANLGLSIRFSH